MCCWSGITGRSIHKRLEAAGIHEWDYVDPALVRLHSEGRGMDWTKRNVEKNKDAVERVYRMLADEKSRKVFRAVLEHRMSHDLARIDAVYDKEQYFGNDVIPYAVGNFVDCGAFCGDTLKRFFRQKISSGGG